MESSYTIKKGTRPICKTFLEVAKQFLQARARTHTHTPPRRQKSGSTTCTPLSFSSIFIRKLEGKRKGKEGGRGGEEREAERKKEGEGGGERRREKRVIGWLGGRVLCLPYSMSEVNKDRSRDEVLARGELDVSQASHLCAC